MFRTNLILQITLIISLAVAVSTAPCIINNVPTVTIVIVFSTRATTQLFALPSNTMMYPTQLSRNIIFSG